MKHDESVFQAQCVEWYRLQYPDMIIFAIPNGGYKLSAQLAYRFKAMGVLKGVPDLFVPHARNGYNGMFIEIKLPTTRATREQDEMHAVLKEENFRVEICRTIDEFIRTVQEYLGRRHFRDATPLRDGKENQ
ncbi:MAG: VRR-NUC domain-containing protein [Deltaproteobacteria bacterium]|nr:VRR-NUC domain-containing protein [Deltaproteobacteria bacterium]